MPESTCLHIQDRESGPIRVVELPWISVRIGRAAYCEVRLPDVGRRRRSLPPHATGPDLEPRPVRPGGPDPARRPAARRPLPLAVRRPLPHRPVLPDAPPRRGRRARLGALSRDRAVRRLTRHPRRSLSDAPRGSEAMAAETVDASSSTSPEGPGRPTADPERWRARWKAAEDHFKSRASRLVAGTPRFVLHRAPAPREPIRPCPLRVAAPPPVEPPRVRADTSNPPVEPAWTCLSGPTPAPRVGPAFGRAAPRPPAPTSDRTAPPVPRRPRPRPRSRIRPAAMPAIECEAGQFDEIVEPPRRGLAGTAASRRRARRGPAARSRAGAARVSHTQSPEPCRSPEPVTAGRRPDRPVEQRAREAGFNGRGGVRRHESAVKAAGRDRRANARRRAPGPIRSASSASEDDFGGSAAPGAEPSGPEDRSCRRSATSWRITATAPDLGRRSSAARRASRPCRRSRTSPASGRCPAGSPCRRSGRSCWRRGCRLRPLLVVDGRRVDRGRADAAAAGLRRLRPATAVARRTAPRPAAGGSRRPRSTWRTGPFTPPASDNRPGSLGVGGADARDPGARDLAAEPDGPAGDGAARGPRPGRLGPDPRPGTEPRLGEPRLERPAADGFGQEGGGAAALSSGALGRRRRRPVAVRDRPDSTTTRPSRRYFLPAEDAVRDIVAELAATGGAAVPRMVEGPARDTRRPAGHGPAAPRAGAFRGRRAPRRAARRR